MFNFPSSPTVGQEYSSGGIYYTWNGYGWALKSETDASEVVMKAGDTMTGPLLLNNDAWLGFGGSSGYAGMWAYAGTPNVDANLRWGVALGGDAPPFSRFSIDRFGDNGVWVDSPIAIDRATGRVTFNGASVATAAEYRANSAPTKMLTPGAVWDAAAIVTVYELAGAFTPDFAAGFDFSISMVTAGRTLASPLNAKAGQKGWIGIQNSSGTATITTWGASYKFPGGIKPTLTATTGAWDIISYSVYGAAYIMCNFVGDFK